MSGTLWNDQAERDMREMLARHSAPIIRLAFGYVKNLSDAEDIAQEVFLAYLRKRPLFADQKRERAWFMRVTANKCKDFLKSYGRTHTLPLTEELPFMPPEESEVIRAVLELDEKYRIPIWLFYFYGCSLKEIGRCMRVKPATVGTWLDRGRKLLRDKLGDDFDA